MPIYGVVHARRRGRVNSLSGVRQRIAAAHAGDGQLPRLVGVGEKTGRPVGRLLRHARVVNMGNVEVRLKAPRPKGGTPDGLPGPRQTTSGPNMHRPQ